MAGKSILNEDELQSVSGGANMSITSKSGGVVRSGAGLGYGQVTVLPKGSMVCTTGNTQSNGMDGYTWFEISSPVWGWIAGINIGF